jgi:glycosyltransferase involved in cell wall biosynthesis
LADVVKFDTGMVSSALSAMARLEAVAVRKAERVFTPSRFSADKIMALYGLPAEKIEVAPNGLFAEDVPPLSPRTSAPPVVLCIARLYKRKGVDLLLRAWPEIISKVPGAILKIAGDGLEAKNLRRLATELGIEKTALFLGDVSSRDKIAALYAEASIFCLPTLHETFGIVFIEAMAAGLPVVAVNDSAVPEVVRDGEDGLLVQPEPGRIAHSVVSLLNDGALREKMGRAGRERVLKEFLWKKTSAGLVDYISRW